ncbi:hypothetical protein LOK49_LG15G01927 [Camellia lanceoleosa]|uniref:Uncharacterized protein n=1 Tax=Camellia lanceoleosa TaxID=1840588 RepID=A0ACC0F132_9ERIC|nr:hypothetical protein LOK49_LG15G01927 [Camellia lanceoleosa]
MLIKEKRQNDGTNPSQRSSDLLQSTPHDNLPTSVNEVGSVTESIEAMKISKRVGSSIANLPICLDTVNAYLDISAIYFLIDNSTNVHHAKHITPLIYALPELNSF